MEQTFTEWYEKYPDYRKYDNNTKINNKNMEKEMKIFPPEGYEIDKENSTFECIKFKKIEKELPKTWEEFCRMKPDTQKDYYISTNEGVLPVKQSFDAVCRKRHVDLDKNLLPNKETAEAMLALCQLIQLRDCYNDGWVPDWEEEMENKYSICANCNKIEPQMWHTYSRILTFKTPEVRDQFLENFKDLIEIAKPLL